MKSVALGKPLAVLLATLVWLLQMLAASSEPGATYDDAQGLHDWLRRFSPLIRPVHNQSDVTQVNVWINITLIHDLDIVNQFFDVSGYFTLTWNVDKTRWNPQDYGGITKTRLPASSIWKPDLYIDNVVSQHGAFRQSGETTLYHDGHILWEPGFSAKIACNMDIRTFPFDTQTCFISLFSWSQTVEVVQLQAMHPETIQQSRYFNMKYDVQGVAVAEVPLIFDYGYREAHLYSTLLYTLRFWRRPWIHVLGTLLPVALLAVLAACSFLMAPDSGDKLSLAVAALLSFTVFLEVIQNDLPSASDKLPYLVIYVAALQAVGFVAVMGNMVVVRLYQLGEKQEARLPHSPGENSTTAPGLLPPGVLGTASGLLPSGGLGKAPRDQSVTQGSPEGTRLMDHHQNLETGDDDLQSTASPDCIRPEVPGEDSRHGQLSRRSSGFEAVSQLSRECGWRYEGSDGRLRLNATQQRESEGQGHLGAKTSLLFKNPDISMPESVHCMHACCQLFAKPCLIRNRGLTSERLPPALSDSAYDENWRVQTMELTNQHRERPGDLTRGRGHLDDGHCSVRGGRGPAGRCGEGGFCLCLLAEAWGRQDWKQVARILNRVLFVLVVLILVIANLALLLALTL